MTIKCVGCYDLHREEITVNDKPLVVYDCQRFPYSTTIRGLLRPGMHIVLEAEDCPVNIEQSCILCPKHPVTAYGGDRPIAYTCGVHDIAWGKWLDEHPEQRAYISPRNRAINSNWIEVFREFIEDMREEKQDDKTT